MKICTLWPNTVTHTERQPSSSCSGCSNSSWSSGSGLRGKRKRSGRMGSPKWMKGTCVHQQLKTRVIGFMTCIIRWRMYREAPHYSTDTHAVSPPLVIHLCLLVFLSSCLLVFSSSRLLVLSSSRLLSPSQVLEFDASGIP